MAIELNPRRMYPEQGDGLSAHERYMQGLPVNDELASLKRGGNVPLSGKTRPAPPPIDSPDRELTRAERAALRELRLHEGWPVYQRLLEKLFRIHEKGAINVSGADPLSRPLTVVNAWAYVAMYRQARNEAEQAMQQEVEKEE